MFAAILASSKPSYSGERESRADPLGGLRPDGVSQNPAHGSFGPNAYLAGICAGGAPMTIAISSWSRRGMSPGLPVVACRRRRPPRWRPVDSSLPRTSHRAEPPTLRRTGRGWAASSQAPRCGAPRSRRACAGGRCTVADTLGAVAGRPLHHEPADRRVGDIDPDPAWDLDAATIYEDVQMGVHVVGEELLRRGSQTRLSDERHGISRQEP